MNSTQINESWPKAIVCLTNPASIEDIHCPAIHSYAIDKRSPYMLESLCAYMMLIASRGSIVHTIYMKTMQICF